MMYKLLPASTKAFRLSGEKAAAVAPVMEKGVLLFDAASKRKTWFTVSAVSDTITEFPFGETASAFPGAEGNCVTVFEVENTISPLVFCCEKSVPRNTEPVVVPVGMTKELGVAVRLIAAPTEFAGLEAVPEVLIGTIVLTQPARFAHPSLVTRTVWLGVRLVWPTITRITFPG